MNGLSYEIQVAQHKAYMKKVSLSGRPKAKVSRLRHSGALRAQPWGYSRHRFTHLSWEFQGPEDGVAEIQTSITTITDK